MQEPTPASDAQPETSAPGEDLNEMHAEVLQLQQFVRSEARSEVSPAVTSAPAPALWLSEEDEPTADQLVDDDRDLLVVEDQVAVEVAAAPAMGPDR